MMRQHVDGRQSGYERYKSRAALREREPPGADIARDLGIARNQLYKWQTELRARGSGAFPGSGARKERTTEIARLQRELARVTEERDILKKAAAYFARESR